MSLDDSIPVPGSPKTKTVIRTTDTLPELKSALASPGVVEFEEGDHRYPDRIELTSSDVSIIIPPGATVGFADGSDPTTINYSGAQALLFYANPTGSLENITLVNNGTIDPNTSGITPTRAGGLYFETVHDATVLSNGGNVIDAHIPYTFIDCDNLTARGLYSNDANTTGTTGGIPVLHMEGCRGFEIQDIMGESCPCDVIDMNGTNATGTVRNVHGRNISGTTVLDLNRSEDVEVTGLFESGSTHPDSVLLFGTTSSDKTSRPATTGDGCTVSTIVGTSNDIGIQINAGSVSHKNLTIKNLDIVSAGGWAMNIYGNADNVLDGLSIEGYAESQSGTTNRAVNMETSVQTENVTFNLEVTSAGGDGMLISNIDGLRGSINVHDVPGTGVIYQSTGTGLTMGNVAMSVIATDNGARGIEVEHTGGVCSDFVIHTTAHGNGTTDVVALPGTEDIEFYGNWGNMNAGGTRTVMNGVSRNAGNPATTGQWNGQGREGIQVYDTTNAVKYWYVNGAWV